MKKVLIVGGGASGLAAAIGAAESGAKVHILEQMPEPGKKLLATGNGRCNFTNAVFHEHSYRGESPEFAYMVLKEFNQTQTLDWFASLGIPFVAKGDYYYPYSLQAVSLRNALVQEAKRLQVTIECNCSVSAIKKEQEEFVLTTSLGERRGDKVILACGGMAQEKLGSNGSGYSLAKEAGLSLTKVYPALTSLHCELSQAEEKKFFQQVAGVRAPGILAFGNKEEAGEIQWTAYGISGIPAFQISTYVGKMLLSHNKENVQVTFVPDYTKEEMTAYFREGWNHNPNKTTLELASGLFPEKLAKGLLGKAHLPQGKVTESQQESCISLLVSALKQQEFQIVKTGDFSEAQVTAGGVDTRDISPKTMEAKRIKGLFVTGELLDIDGTCGGYNLQFAWSTGRLAGMAAAREEKEGSEGA